MRPRKRWNHRLAGQANRRTIHLRNTLGQTIRRQLDAVGAKGVGFNDIRTGFNIFLVNPQYQLGLCQTQIVITHIHKYATLVDHRPHGAIEDQHVRPYLI